MHSQRSAQTSTQSGHARASRRRPRGDCAAPSELHRMKPSMSTAPTNEKTNNHVKAPPPVPSDLNHPLFRERKQREKERGRRASSRSSHDQSEPPGWHAVARCRPLANNQTAHTVEQRKKDLALTPGAGGGAAWGTRWGGRDRLVGGT